MKGFLNQCINKLKEQLHKAQCENHERETMLLLHDTIVSHRPGLTGLFVEEIACLGWARSALLLLTADPSRRLANCPNKRGNISRFITSINNHTR